MTQTPLWGQIPAELRERAQWLVAGPTKAPLGIDAHGHTYNGSVTDPRTWCAFDVAARYALHHNLAIGYVISDTDPFCCIDLDWTDADSQKRKGKPIDPSKWSTAADANRYNFIMQTFASYTERSVSGKGLHVWVRADIGEGRRRDGVEVYSQARFIVCTGDRLSGLSPLIEDRQQLVEVMLQDMMNSVDKRTPLGTLVELPQEPEDELCDDAFVFYLATNAENAFKFNELFCGRWEQYQFPSQSEADLALMSMFTFYSDINSQCRRLFRQSVLGQREKAIKNDRYLNYTLRLIRHRQAHEETNEQDKANAQTLLKSTSLEQAEHVPLSSEQHTALPMPMPAAVAAATLTTPPPTRDGALEYPPGFAGAVAEFIYGSAPRPVKQVAIVSALGLLAGIMGKAWHIPQSGLNLYIILIARSGIGKEAMHSGISAIIKASRSPMLQTFVEFSDFVSGPALVKFCASNSSFVNVAGEWGQKLKRLARDDGSDAAMATLRTIMTNLYQKSGPQAIMGGLLYSNKDNKIDSVSGVAYSMIGETTPDTFYEALTESMMADGFLSRFTIVEYDGDRPDENPNQNLNPPQAIIDHITNIAAMAVSINGTGGAINPSGRESLLVGRTDEAAAIIKEFNAECDSQIRGSKDEAWRQMWNRASLKAQRIAALLGAADRPSYPCIMPEHIEWAIDLVRRDITIMRSKIEKGDVGMGDHSRQRKLVNILREYMTGTPAPGYKPNMKMHADNVVPSSYLQIRTGRLAVFAKNRLGATASLAQALREFTDAGWLKEIEKAKAMLDYNYRGKCYMIVDLPIHQAKE